MHDFNDTHAISCSWIDSFINYKVLNSWSQVKEIILKEITAYVSNQIKCQSH